MTKNKEAKSVCELCGKELEYGRHCGGGCKTKTQHTPGPWEISKADDGQYVVGKNNSLTQVYRYFDRKQAIEKWIELYGENEAFCLIAAAPELLEAAKHFMDCEARKNGWIDCPECEISEAAIAKAEKK